MSESPAPTACNSRRMHILPPPLCAEDVSVTGEDPGPPIRDININDDDVWDDEDDALSLSLYVGVENYQHRLVEVLPYRDLAAIPFAEVAVIANDPEKQGTFPVLLHHMLSSDLYSGPIAWFENGRAFLMWRSSLLKYVNCTFVQVTRR